MPNYAAVPVVRGPHRTLEQVFQAYIYGMPMDLEEKKRLLDTAYEIVRDRWMIAGEEEPR